MAKRVQPELDQKWRDKIGTSMLINRLNSFAMGGVDPKTKKPIEMSDGQIRAALGLLRKVLPDLSSTEVNATHEHHYVARMPGVAQSSDEWQKQHSPTIQ